MERPAPAIRDLVSTRGESEIVERLTPDYGRRAPSIQATARRQIIGTRSSTDALAVVQRIFDAFCNLCPTESGNVPDVQMLFEREGGRRLRGF
jgi:hypothetical protein